MRQVVGKAVSTRLPVNPGTRLSAHAANLQHVSNVRGQAPPKTCRPSTSGWRRCKSINQRISFLSEQAGLTNLNTQRITVALRVAVNLRGSGYDDGGGMACRIQDVGLNHERWSATLAKLFSAGLRFKVNLPNWPSSTGTCGFIHGRHQSMHPELRFPADAWQTVAWTKTPCDPSARAHFFRAPLYARTQSLAC